MEHSRHITETNVAACGSLLLEFGTLSRLTGATELRMPCLHLPCHKSKHACLLSAPVKKHLRRGKIHTYPGSSKEELQLLAYQLGS